MAKMTERRGEHILLQGKQQNTRVFILLTAVRGIQQLFQTAGFTISIKLLSPIIDDVNIQQSVKLFVMPNNCL